MNQASDEDATVEIGVYTEINVSRTIIFYANQSLQTIRAALEWERRCASINPTPSCLLIIV